MDIEKLRVEPDLVYPEHPVKIVDHKIWWLSIVAAAMSFTYTTIGLSLGIA